MADLLADADFNVAAHDYIRSRHGQKLEPRLVFSSYAERVNTFYAWVERAYDAHLPSEVSDYRRVWQAHRTAHARAWWNIALKQLVNPDTDPFAHLDKFLPLADVAEILALPRNSRDQADRAIALIDEEGACDSELRVLVYKLFRVACETGPSSSLA